MFQDVLTYWLKLGISGFRLANTQYLTEDPQLRDESRSFVPVETNNYHSLTHIYTRDRLENVAVLTKWHEIVYNETNGKGYVCFYNSTYCAYFCLTCAVIFIADCSHCKILLLLIFCKFITRRRQ